MNGRPHRPRDARLRDPGHPASHGCIRLLEDDAIWLHDWAGAGGDAPGAGTPVLVTGDYEYGARPPWMRLAADPRATDVDAAALDAEIPLRSVTAVDLVRTS